VVPAFEVAGSLLGRQATVDQAHACPALCRFESDRHRRGARCQVVGILPAPGEHDPLAGLDFGDRAGRGVPRTDRPPVPAACPQLDAGRDRLPPSQAFRLGQESEGLLWVQRHQHGLLYGHAVISSFRWAGSGELLELVGPEHVECVVQRGHSLRIEPVVAEPALLACLYQPCIGQHPQMLRNGRPRDSELSCEPAHRLLACRQQLEESPPVGFGDDRHQIGHDVTLADTNTLCGRPRKAQLRCPRRWSTASE